MLVRADNPTPDGFLDPNDEGPVQILFDGYLHFGCHAILAGGPFEDVTVIPEILKTAQLADE